MSAGKIDAQVGWPHLETEMYRAERVPQRAVQERLLAAPVVRASYYRHWPRSYYVSAPERSEPEDERDEDRKDEPEDERENDREDEPEE